MLELSADQPKCHDRSMSRGSGSEPGRCTQPATAHNITDGSLDNRQFRERNTNFPAG